MIKLVMTISLMFLVGCAADTSQPKGSGGTAAAGTSCPVATSVTPDPLVDQFLIACPESLSAFPEVLQRSGVSVLLVTKVGNSVSYSVRSPGFHTSADGRNCQYEVTSSGEVISQ